jgi:hypothetical protein
MSKVSGNGQLHIVEGSITYSGGTPSVTSNDASMSTITDNADGDTTVSWNHEFLSAPTVLLTPLNSGTTVTTHHIVRLVSITTTAFRVLTASVIDTGAGATDLAAADITINFTIIGTRNN